MGELGDRSASKLSGGQQQRVALARAFVFSPSVLLFDEPLSNLDAKLRAEMRIEIKELQRRLGITSVYVTHDLEEALAISDRIVVMKDGVIEQIGRPGRDLRPAAQCLRRRLRGLGQLDPRPPSRRTCRARARSCWRRRGRAHPRDGLRPAVGAEPVLSVRTVHVRISREAATASANVWPATIRRRVFQGDFTQYHVDWDGRQLVVRCATGEPLGEGEPVY